MSKHRSYCFTINNDTYDDLDRLLEMEYKYMIFGFEEGKKGTTHIQGYVQFHSPISFVSIHHKMPRAHIEISKGTPLQNINYCSKDNDYYEFGTRPTEGGRLTFEQIDAAFKDPENNTNIIRLYGRTYETLKQLVVRQQDRRTKFYVVNPQFDAITEVHDYFGSIADLAVIVEMADLAAYDDPKNILLFTDGLEQRHLNWARGAPITYKYGYEMRIVKPYRLIIVTQTPGLYPLYKNIICH